MLKRISLFLLTNILIIGTISILTSVLGIRPYLSANGIDYQALLIFCVLWGTVGSFISLLMSRQMAKWMMGVKVIDPQNAGQHASLVNMIHRIAQSAQLPAMPQVGIYESNDINAFATGPSKSKSLVAVSTGLLQYMNNAETEGVIAHEIAHIKNGDMVTMTLVQAVVNIFVMFFSRVLANVACNFVDDERKAMVRMLVTIVLDIALGFLGMIVVASYSRAREFRADSGSAKLVGRDKMVAALEKLKGINGRIDTGDAPESIAAFRISDNSGKFRMLFSTHPPLEKRIEALNKMQYA